MEKRTALILGASGLTGQVLAQLLLADDLYSLVTIYVRKQIAISHPRLQQQIVNYERLDTAVQADDVFCCLGTTIKKAGSQLAFRQVDLVYPQKVAELQRAAGSSRFLLISAVGANEQSSIFYSRIKGEVEKAIQVLGYSCTCIFRPSLIMGERSERRVGEKIAMLLTKIIGPLLIGPLKKYQPVLALSIAKAMQKAAHQFEDGIHFISSDEIKKFE
ncbi:NAD(P)H-binding protein [Sediminibacterium sp.]|uniref:NAD-dependent epimerase/dehydratase family protein n=1 Tax=Sediminibacterium sp. TaxID=1917865 RepID=UPI0025CFB997|nr:NAD(P)H-binding protein [Sediminibacterium sp.]MBW0178772.1 NAD(P)H-binding protein [Sediminibacterium sp.]